MEIFVKYDGIVQCAVKGEGLVILSVSEGTQLYGGSTGDVTLLKQSLEILHSALLHSGSQTMDVR